MFLHKPILTYSLFYKLYKYVHINHLIFSSVSTEVELNFSLHGGLYIKYITYKLTHLMGN